MQALTYGDSDDPAKMTDTKMDIVSRVPVAAVRCADALYTRARTRTHTRVLCNAHVVCRPLLSSGASLVHGGGACERDVGDTSHMRALCEV